MVKCSVDNCNNISEKKGWCNKHYLKFYKTAKDYRPVDGRRTHHLYLIWWQRKSDKTLCETWLNFDNFIKDVGDRPGKDFYLIRIKDGLFGPDNFKWTEHLRKRDDESFRQWWARKRAKKIELNPNLESDRNIKRVYGLTRNQYNAKLWSQNGVCAICGEKESSIDGRTNKPKLLAIDHCHTTNKIRDLLCWRCNTVIGRINEDLDLIDKIKQYLTKHKETVNGC